jgi:hypothetical protein
LVVTTDAGLAFGAVNLEPTIYQAGHLWRQPVIKGSGWIWNERHPGVARSKKFFYSAN